MAKSIVLNGTNQYVSVANHADFYDLDQLSICVWIKPSVTLDTSTPETNKDIFAKNVSGANVAGDYELYFWNGAGEIDFNFQNGSSVYGVGTGTKKWESGVWYHIVVTYDRTLPSARLKMYVNGQLQSTANAIDYQIPDNAEQIRIGTKQDADGFFWPGNIDEVIFYKNVALTKGQIVSIYGGGTPPSSGQKLYLQFEDNVLDSSGNGHNGIASGSPLYVSNEMRGGQIVRQAYPVDDERAFPAGFASSSSLSSTSSSLSSSSLSISSSSLSSSSSYSNSSSSSSSSSLSLSSSSLSSSSSSSSSITAGIVEGTLMDRIGEAIDCSINNIRINVYQKNNSILAPIMTTLCTSTNGTWSISGLAASTKYLVVFERQGFYSPLSDTDIAGAEFITSS